jgi:hypothetical protein
MSYQNGTSGGAHTSDIKQLLGLLKMREQGGSICFALLFPFTFLEAIKIIGNLLATAFRQGLHVFIIVEFGTATLVLKHLCYYPPTHFQLGSPCFAKYKPSGARFC